MNAITTRIKLIALMMGLFGLLSASYAQTVTWDVRGNWNVGFFVEDGQYNLTMNITNEDFSTGVFSGTDTQQGYQITGSVTSSNIQFVDTGRPGWSLSFDGEISTNGTMSGGQDGVPGEMIYYGNIAWHGWFWTISGQAVPVSTSAPVFTLEPASQIINAGQSVTFTASATGFPAPTYQWQFNGIDIVNATDASYSLSSTGVTNLGLYDVVASNSIGTNVSTTASLSFLDMKCFPGLVLYGPVGMAYSIQASSALGDGTNWMTITNITLTSVQPFIYIDFSSVTNGLMFYRAVPQ